MDQRQGMRNILLILSGLIANTISKGCFILGSHMKLNVQGNIDILLPVYFKLGQEINCNLGVFWCNLGIIFDYGDFYDRLQL